MGIVFDRQGVSVEEMVQEVNKAKGNLEKVEKELKQMSALNKVCRHRNFWMFYFADFVWLGFPVYRLSRLPYSFVWPAGKSSGDISLSAANTFSNTICPIVVIMARSCLTTIRPLWIFESVLHFFEDGPWYLTFRCFLGANG